MPKKYLFILISLASVALCSLLFLSPLDNKVFDQFLRVIPSLTEDDSVLIITVDDSAIENVGIFPWTRDILADAIVFLREMGADTVAFDLNYLDRSPVRVDPDYVQNELPAYLDNSFRRIDDVVGQVMDGFSQGIIGPSEAQDYKEQIYDFNRTVRDDIDVSIAYVTRDVDAYFAKTLKFFGKSYLTLTMVSENDILSEDKSFDMSSFNLPYLEEHIALLSIQSEQDTRTPDQPGIIPAISMLLNQAKGAGFVNADPDKDGYRRRVHLLMKHGGNYYGQLALMGILELTGNPEIAVNNSHITLRNAVIKGKTRNIRIPRDEDGAVLIKWPKKSFYEYNIMSSWDLIQYNRLEGIFARNLSLMDESGFFSYWDDYDTPLDKYNNANYVKELLYEGERPQDSVSFDTYMDFRQQYLDAAQAFLHGSYEDAILSDVGSETEIGGYVSELFDICRDQYGQLIEIRSRVSERAEGTLSIIGVAATSMTDESLIAFEERYPNVGTYGVIANMILSGEFLDDAPRFVSLFIALVLSLALGLVIHRLDTGKAVFAGLLSLLITALFFLIFFAITKLYLGAVVPFASVTLTFLSLSGFNFFSTAREKSFLRSAFSRYLAPEVINEIISDPSKLNLGGEKREMSAIFTDLRGFSSISEALDPADLVNLLNLYLTTMSNIVMENRGTIDKYEGDAIIAFFGAPIATAEHAALACRTAVRMKKAEAELNVKIAEEKLSPAPLFTRIGINSGEMIVGNMGTPSKMDYTIMGNAVNLAARLEGVNKQYNTGGILISEYTRGQIGNDFVLRSLDRVRVVGINTPLRLFELLEIKEDAPAELINTAEAWEQGMSLYEQFKFNDALAVFSGISKDNPEDRVAKLYCARCEKYLKEAPPEGWDGVYNLTQK